MAEKACHGFGSTTQVGLTQALGMLGKIIAVVLIVLIVSGAGIAHASGCVVQVASGDSHSSIAQHLVVNLRERIAASKTLSLAAANHYDLEFYLVRAPANDITRYPEDQQFRAFYVLTDARRKLISADVNNCTDNGQSCAASMVRELEGTCSRMPNNSFKPNLLRSTNNMAG